MSWISPTASARMPTELPSHYRWQPCTGAIDKMGKVNIVHLNFHSERNHNLYVAYQLVQFVRHMREQNHQARPIQHILLPRLPFPCLERPHHISATIPNSRSLLSSSTEVVVAAVILAWSVQPNLSITTWRRTFRGWELRWRLCHPCCVAH